MRALLATALLLVSSSVLADDLQPLQHARNAVTGVAMDIYLSKGSLGREANGNLHFLLESHFSKPQTDPNNPHNTFSWLINPVVVNCKAGTAMGQAVILGNEAHQEVAMYNSGETKMTAPAGKAQSARQAALAYACSHPPAK